MRYSNYIGAIAAFALIISCFLPWAYVPSIDSILTGVDTPNTRFGKPGLLNIIFAALAILFFLIPKLWAKRINIFVGAFNLAWTIRNFILLGLCEVGECPEKKYGIYLSLLGSVVLLAMSLFPSGNSKAGTE